MKSFELILLQVRQTVRYRTEQWDSKVTRFATDLGTPLPLRFGPDGNLYYAIFSGGGTLYRITAN